MFVLIDCNNFFVSCERVFRPDLEGKPVVVLSSNDGCAVARSNEVKALGVPMGAPAFKYRELFEREGVVKFSANFELYGNIARRITNILSDVTPRIEVYSIDESFLDISALPIRDLNEWGSALSARILREVGVPVSLGIAPTKTLAKLASLIAKKDPKLNGALTITEENREQHLAHFPVEDIWGVGWKLAPRLKASGISTALRLADMQPRHAQQLMGITGRQMVAELNGTICFPLHKIKSVRKSIMRGRTFGEDTGQSHVIEAAIASLISRAAFRLRSENQAARRVGLLLETNRHKPGYRRWYREVILPTPTNDSGELIATLVREFAEIHNPAQAYHRTNTYLYDFTPAGQMQTDLLGTFNSTRHDHTAARMAALDAVNNRFGRGHLYYAAEDLSKSWQPKQQVRSPRYVSHWDELPVARVYANRLAA